VERGRVYYQGERLTNPNDAVEIDSADFPMGEKKDCYEFFQPTFEFTRTLNLSPDVRTARYENASKVADVAKAFIRYETNVFVSLLEALPDQRVYDRYITVSMNDAIRRSSVTTR
jgi:hypothetical protein